MGRAEDLFKKIKTKKITAIEDFILERQREELFLDFKRSSTKVTDNKLSDPDRKNLAKAICGFGNSEGGVVVWGVECTKNSDEGDVASAKFPLPDVNKFASLIESQISGVTLPPHTKVENLILKTGTNEEGFVITYIPQNQGFPLQDIIKKHFYIRAGSDFLPAPYQVIASMFGKRPQPNVYNMYTIGPAKLLSDGSISTQVGFMLHNQGPGVARDLFINVRIWSLPGNCKLSFETPDRENWGGSFNLGRFMYLISKHDLRLAPDSEAQPLLVNLVFKPPFDKNFHLKITAGCSGGPIYKAEIQTSSKRIEQLFSQYATQQVVWTSDVGHEVTKKLFKTKLRSSFS